MAGHSLLALAALLSALTSRVPTVDDPLYSTAAGRAYLREVFREGGNGLLDSERAAFIVDRSDGSSGCLLWPPTHLMHEEAYRGPIPAGTTAIVHTHPNFWPMPSEHDRQEALRLGIPIYVVSAQTVYKTEGGRVMRVAPSAWYRPEPGQKVGGQCERLN